MKTQPTLRCHPPSAAMASRSDRTPKPCAHRVGMILLTLLALGACDTTGDFKNHVPYAPHNPHAATATPITQARTIDFDVSGVTLSDRARADIDDFLARHRVDRRDRIMVAVPKGAGGLALGRAERVGAYLAHRRLDAEIVAAKVDPLRPSQVSLVIERHQVTLPACPDWTGVGGVTHDNRVSRNWGCANAVNLGLMVANPRDLAAGRDPGVGDGEALVLAIQRYRAGETKPLMGSTTGSAAPASESSEKGDSGK